MYACWSRGCFLWFRVSRLTRAGELAVNILTPAICLAGFGVLPFCLQALFSCDHRRSMPEQFAGIEALYAVISSVALLHVSFR